jgi:hypothetical protein
LKKPQKKTTRQGCHSLKKLKTMNTVTQPTQPIQDKAAAIFDVALSLPPADTNLDSEYFQAYIKEVIKTGNTPF